MTDTLPQPNTDEAIRFLQRWPAAFPHLTAIHVDPVTHIKGLIEARAFTTPVDWDAVRRWIDDRQGHANLYFTVNSLIGPLNSKAAKKNIGEVVALHVDADVEPGEDQHAAAAALVAKLQAFEPPPTCVIASGGGAQGFWVLERESRIGVSGDEALCEDAERYTRALEEAFGSDHTHNVDRVMRLPGTINVPDAKKISKGRKPALASLVTYVEDRAYPLSAFKKAEQKHAVAAFPLPTAADGTPLKGNAGATALTRMKVNVDWEAAAEIYKEHRLGLDALRERGVEQHALLTLEWGGNLLTLHDKHLAIGHRMQEGPYSSYSDITLAIATALLKAGLSPEECACVMSDPNLSGNKHVISKDKVPEKRRAIGRALGKAMADLAARDARARATANGTPVWRDTWDEAGLYPKWTFGNTKIALAALGVEARLDLFHDKVLISYNGETRELSVVNGKVNDKGVLVLRDLMDERWQYDPGKTSIEDAIGALALRNTFDPVLDYLDGLQWDGTPRLDKWTHTYLGVKDTPLSSAIGSTTLMAAVRRAKVPGCKYDPITVLESPEGYGKSKAIRILAGDDNFSDQTIIGTDDRKQQELLQGVWIYECAELSGMSRAEVEHTKTFASRQVDKARPAFGHYVEERARRGIIMATTNDKQYLLSQTGNRRFLPLEVSKIDLAALVRDRDQLWAEAVVRELEHRKTGKDIEIDETLWDDAREAQERRRVGDPWEDTLSSIPAFVTEHDGLGRQDHRILWLSQDGKTQMVLSNAIMQWVLRLPSAQQTPASGKRVAAIMQRLGWTRPDGPIRVKPGAQRERGYERPTPPDWKEPQGGGTSGDNGRGSGEHAGARKPGDTERPKVAGDSRLPLRGPGDGVPF